MKRLNLIPYFIFLLWSSVCFAEDLSLHTKLTSKRSQLGVSYEFSQFTSDEGDIVGSGGKLHFFHTFNEKLSTQIYLSAALNNQGETQNSFTGVGGIVFYNLFGKTYSQQKEIYLSNQLFATERVEPSQALLVGAGISQYFFNGNEGVYSASGFNVALAYNFTFYKIRWEALAKYNALGAGSTSLTGTNVSLGFVIPL